MNTIGSISCQDTAKSEQGITCVGHLIYGKYTLWWGAHHAMVQRFLLESHVSEFMVQLAANIVPARTTRVEIPLADAFFSITETYFPNEWKSPDYLWPYGIYNIAVHTGYDHIG